MSRLMRVMANAHLFMLPLCNMMFAVICFVLTINFVLFNYCVSQRFLTKS